VIEGTRTQLLDLELLHAFWAESAAAHCYVHSFLPSMQHPDKIPIQVWIGHSTKPNVSHLWPWGCRAYVTDLD
jgi:hypothetical protein